MGVCDCTIRRQNAHGIEDREVLYSWHPWAGRSVFIKEVVERKSGGVFRCVCREQSLDVVLELPSWMFDRATCAMARVLANPRVDLTALRALRGLLNDIAKDRTSGQSTPSNIPFPSATMDSHDQNRGEAHAGSATSPSSKSAPDTAALSIQGGRRRATARTQLGSAADTNPTSADGSHGAIDPRSQRQRARAPSKGAAS